MTSSELLNRLYHSAAPTTATPVADNKPKRVRKPKAAPTAAPSAVAKSNGLGDWPSVPTNSPDYMIKVARQMRMPEYWTQATESLRNNSKEHMASLFLASASAEALVHDLESVHGRRFGTGTGYSALDIVGVQLCIAMNRPIPTKIAGADPTDEDLKAMRPWTSRKSRMHKLAQACIKAGVAVNMLSLVTNEKMQDMLVDGMSRLLKSGKFAAAVTDAASGQLTNQAFGVKYLDRKAGPSMSPDRVDSMLVARLANWIAGRPDRIALVRDLCDKASAALPKP